jgi:hypothetical protein
MPNTHAVETNHEYRNIPVATLVESPTNPRKRFDEKTLGELAASFKTQGVLEPLLVRPLDESKYEVVIGARRLKAARLAEGVIASSEQQFGTPHSPSSQSDRSLSWAYRDSSADLKPLQWISPDNARFQPLGPVGGVCSSLLRCAVEINSKVQEMSRL